MTDMQKTSQMQELLQSSEQHMQKVRESNILAEMEQTQLELEKASKIENDQERDRVTEILETRMDELRKSVVKEEEDLAEAVFGLNIIIEQLGGSYEQLTQLTPEEQRLINSAKAELAKAEQLLEDAKNSWVFKKSRIEEAEANLEMSKEKLNQAKVEANRLMRQRLLSASMEDSLQDFQNRVAKTISIMKDRKEEIDKQVKAVEARKAEAFAEKERQAVILKNAEDDVSDIENNLYDAEQTLNGMPNGSPEYTAQEKEISDLKSKLEDAKGTRDVALGVFQSKEKFVKELEIHEAAQKKLRNNQLIWIKTLESDTEERVITFKSRLEAMKASSDQEIAKKLDDLGAEVDDKNAKYMAQTTVASDKIMADKIGAHPDRLRKMQETQSALTQHISKADSNIKDMVEKMTSKYGIDPTESQFSHWAEQS